MNNKELQAIKACLKTCRKHDLKVDYDDVDALFLIIEAQAKELERLIELIEDQARELNRRNDIISQFHIQGKETSQKELIGE